MQPNPAPDTCDYWWYREPNQQPKVYGTRLFHGKVRAWHYAGAMRWVRDMTGEWSGPIPCPFK